MDFVLYILPFGFVRLRTFCLAHGLVRCNMNAGVHAARRGSVIHRCQNKTPDEKCDQEMWVTTRTGSVGWDLRKVSWVPASERKSWVIASEEDGWFSELAEALRRVPHVVWGRWKSQHRKIVYLPHYVEKPFNSKVIKSFVPPEQRSRKCFRVSGFLCSIYIYIWVWTFYVYFTYSCMAM